MEGYPSEKVDEEPRNRIYSEDSVGMKEGLKYGSVILHTYLHMYKLSDLKSSLLNLSFGRMKPVISLEKMLI